MHPLTQKLVSELDMLYGLYQMAADLTKRIHPDDEHRTGRVLDARQKILEHTGQASKEIAALLQAFMNEKMVPANEKALVEEKRKLILDVGAKMQAVEHQMIRQMQAKTAEIRRKMADYTERKNAMKAYLRAPRARMMVR